MAGNAFMVEEREGEIPAGYNLIGYKREGDIPEGELANKGVIRNGDDCECMRCSNRWKMSWYGHDYRKLDAH